MTKHTNTKDTQDILNPKTDWVFKLMFSKGEEGNKALISFLNAFLQETYGTIKKADILNTELTRQTPAGETYRLDFLIKTDNGLIVNLEMQQGSTRSYKWYALVEQRVLPMQNVAYKKLSAYNSEKLYAA